MLLRRENYKKSTGQMFSIRGGHLSRARLFFWRHKVFAVDISGRVYTWRAYNPTWWKKRERKKEKKRESRQLLGATLAWCAFVSYIRFPWNKTHLNNNATSKSIGIYRYQSALPPKLEGISQEVELDNLGWTFVYWLFAHFIELLYARTHI